MSSYLRAILAEQLTPWMRRGWRPRRPAVYEVDIPINGMRCFSYFDGELFHGPSFISKGSGVREIKHAIQFAAVFGAILVGKVRWRGLTAEPKA